MKVLKNTKDMNQVLVSRFRENKDILSGSLPGFLKDMREEAIESFSRTGLPGKKNEEYKYTLMEDLFLPEYSMQFIPSKIDFNIGDIFTCDVPNLKTHLEIILNGFYLNKGKALTVHKNGIISGSLAEAVKQYPDIVKEHYAQYAAYKNNSLVALNTAFAQDGLFLYLPKNSVLEQPLQVVHLPMTGLDTMLQYRNLIILEENASAQIIVCDHTLSPFRFLTNSVTEIFTGENAHLHYSKIQNEHLNSNLITNLYVHQEADSQVISNTITLHGGIIRNNTNVTLNATGCDNQTYGLYFADRDQHIDNFVSIDHAKPNCTSRQLFKGILDDRATGAFNGHILVRQDAQKTNAYQTNNNILLSDEARMNTKPQLEIYADDVKCSHGVTTGQLDENALFYMRSRGIPYKEAKFLLLYAFAHEIFDKINVRPLKDRINHLIDKRLRGELSRCNKCAMNCGELNIPG